jgi:molecular chaperone GrpE
MSLEQNTKDKSVNEVEVELETPTSFDDFLKELEEAEKSLHITATDTVLEVEESFDDSPAVDFEIQPAGEEFVLETFAAAEDQGGSAGNIPSSKHEMHELRVKISGLQEERGELRQALQRRQTDFDNFRKRTERERGETFENILAKLSSQMLPVLDNLSRALGSADQVPTEKSKEFEKFIEGILLVNQQLTDVLLEMGIHPIASVGQPFDPHFHEAVATAPDGEKEPGTVIEEILTGYKIGQKVIRPAMVKVSVSPNTVVNE